MQYFLSKTECVKLDCTLMGAFISNCQFSAKETQKYPAETIATTDRHDVT